MPKKVPHNCEACSKLELDNSKLKHCWDNRLCPGRIYRWKNQVKLNEKQRNKARSDETSETVITEIDAPPLWAAELCLWIDCDNNTVHAIGARLWCGSEIVERGKIKPIHLLGATEAQLKQIAINALAALSSAHNISISKYRSISEFDKCECPLLDCKKY
jgi:hypothetical protein